TFLLAGGRGSRLSPLTRRRSKPAVPFGDRCIIDFTLSNCLRSNLFGPHVITQYRLLTSHDTSDGGGLRKLPLGQRPQARPSACPPQRQHIRQLPMRCFGTFIY